MCYRGQIKAVLKSETNTVNVEHFKQPVLPAWLKADILLAGAEPAWDCSGAGEHGEPSSAWDCGESSCSASLWGPEDHAVL